MQDDPYYAREKAKYEQPVASREYILQLINDAERALSFLDICHKVNANDETSRIAVQRRLRAMEREGQVIFNRQKRYEVGSVITHVTGSVIGHRDGFGFLKRDDGERDLYISGGQMQFLLHGDKVAAVAGKKDSKGRIEARNIEIVEPRDEPIVGRFFMESGVGIVIPDDSRLRFELIIPPERVNGAKQGHVVVAEMTQRPRKRVSPIGRIIEVLGEHMAPGMEIEMALRNFDIPHAWPLKVTNEISGLGEEVNEAAKKGRIDLRQLPLVTIDGEDARDFDDAVFCEPQEDGGWQLWVAIADVSYYVRPKKALDDEAQNRGTSVYFPEQVVPMLPEVLSNGLCSLNPNVDRLCMVCEMSISPSGKLQGYQFYEAVMNSHARLTYNKVWAILEGEPELYKRYFDHVPHLQNLYKLYKALKKSRAERGAIEFETQETKFVFNAERKIDHIVPVVRNDAHKIIEECMIMANVAAADMLQSNKAEGLYRIHEEPSEERLKSFLSYLSEVGISHGLTGKATPKQFCDVVKKIQGRPDQELIQTMLLRSMQQAIYDPDNVGHFGLALEAYAHFTSPIRRYPDLVVHRAIKAILDKQAQRKSKTGGYAYNEDEVGMLGEHCSMTERRADDATRDVSDWLKCEFMQAHVGDSFEGVIASVTNFGFFVRLSEFHIDGLVHITTLTNDYYQYDETRQYLIGESGGTIFRLGDQVEVKVIAVNLDERKIDFVLDMPLPTRKSRRASKAKSGKSDQLKAKRIAAKSSRKKPGKKAASGAKTSSSKSKKRGK
ncbi:ribonuclease R [Planctobacterium marinum]|uniref:Ribonuclease R n=1 Tax=Planctobacterium marinum TaxID=1631968 RepID=A0AA48HGT8_9ALTE|nr:ribonuclease R [Planctobacterium marinum]